MAWRRRVRDAGLPHDYPNDVAFRITTTGIEMGRIKIPCRRDRFTVKDGPDGWWPTPEPPHRINQIYLEPELVAHAAKMPSVSFLNRTKVLGFTQTSDTVTAEAQDLDSGETYLITADYLIGCDGPASEIRRQIGARLTGDAMINRTQSTYIRAPALMGMMQATPAWSTQSLNPRRSAGMFAVDGRETWLIHNYLRPDETNFAAVDRDHCIRLILGVGPEFEYQVLTQEDWIGRRMLADRFRNGRVFICGDAAHIWVPYAGYGMNAGIADAMNLSWMLAGVVQGWAAPAILDCLRGRAQADHRAGVALCDEHRHGARAGACRGAGEHRRPWAGRRRCARAHWPGDVRAERGAVLLRRTQFRLFLRSLADHCA